MTVGVAGQGIMAFFFRTVDGLLEAAEERIMNGIDFRSARRFFQNPLQGESIQFTLHFVAQAASEVGEGFELIRLRPGVYAPEERHRMMDASRSSRQVLGDSLIGRQHELLDDLMAYIMLEKVSVADSALIIILQLDFGHVQF